MPSLYMCVSVWIAKSEKGHFQKWRALLGCCCTGSWSYSDDTTVVGLIRNNDHHAYREEVEQLVNWCGRNDLILNVDKTKEIIVDLVEVVRSTKFLPPSRTLDTNAA